MDRSAVAVRAHPLSIAAYLYRFLYLLIIPVARGFISGLTGGLIAWLAGAWLDIVIVLLIVVLSVLKWRCFRYHFDINGVYYTTGIIFQQQAFIPMHRIAILSTMNPFWLRPMRVVKLRVDTIAKNPKKADVSLYLKAEEAARIMRLREQETLADDGVQCEYRPPIMGVVLLSLINSNSFIGIVLISTFISQSGQILGEQIPGLFISTFEEISRQLAGGLPPIAAGMAIFLLLGWLVAFLISLLQTKNLCTRRTADTLHVSGGVLVEKDYALRNQDISFVDIRQSMLTRLLGLYSVFLNAIGFGKERSDIAAIVPFSTRTNALKQLGRLLPECKLTQRVLKPNAGSIFKFIIDPFWPCVLVPASAVVAAWFLPDWFELIRFAGWMLSVPAFWFMGVRLLDFCSSGVSRVDEYFTLRYSSWYYLHTVIISYDKLSLINIRQSILQRGDNKCDFVVSTRAEGRRTHHLRNLDWDGCVELFEAEDIGLVKRAKVKMNPLKASWLWIVHLFEPLRNSAVKN